MSDFLHLNPSLARFIARHGASAFGTELVGEAPELGHVTAAARIFNLDQTRELRVWSAKEGKWRWPGAHGEGTLEFSSVALREARRALGLDFNAPLEGGEATEVRIEEGAGYWNTSAHLHFEVVFAFWSEETEILPRGARWFALEEAALR